MEFLPQEARMGPIIFGGSLCHFSESSEIAEEGVGSRGLL